MPRKALIAALALLIAVSGAEAAGRKGHKAGAGFTMARGINRGLILHAPFTITAAPYTLYNVGSGSLIFTRAHDATHTATYLDKETGLVTVAAADTLRIEAGGALIEGPRTNLCLQSAALGTTWVPTSMTVSNNNTASPDGGVNAERLLATAGNATLIQDLGVLGSAAYTFSIWLKRDVGTGNIQMTLDGGTGWTTKAITTTWTRYSITQTLANPDVGIRIVTNADAVWAWGGQAEAGAWASSYIPTTTAAMLRNEDRLYITSTSNISATEGTAIVTVNTGHTGIAAASAMIVYTNGLGYPSLLLNNTLAAYDGTAFRTGPAITFGTTYVTGSAWSAGEGAMRFVVNGGAVTSTAFDGSFIIDASVLMGSGSSAEHMWGYIKDYRIWNRALSAAEIQAAAK